MSNPIMKEMQGGVTHVTTVACPHPLSCCIYTALIHFVTAYILHLFLYSRPQHFNENVFFSLVLLVFQKQSHAILCVSKGL